MFISHSGRDNAWAIAVKQWLVEQQPDLAQEIFLDIDPETGIHSGQRWKDALRAAKERCEAVVCLVSRHWLGSKECEAEYRAAEYFGKRIYCARIEPLEGINDITREWQRCDLYGQGPRTEVHVGAGHEPVVVRTAGLQQLLTGLRAAGIGADHFPWPPSGEPDRAPYRGWDPFEPQDAAVFFGRDGQIVRAVDAMRAMRTDGSRPLFVVVGASGTGKSSFLRAGLIPRLCRDDRHFVVLDTMRPERDALTGPHGLAATIHATRRRLGLTAPGLGDIKTALTDQNIAVMRQWLTDIQHAARHRLVDATAEAATVVLPIDQAEELLSADAGPEAAGMLALLAGFLSVPVGERLSLIVALTIRTDRYEHLQSNPDLVDIDTVVFDDLKPMPRDRFRDIITGPARRSPRHLEIAPDLVDRLLADCGDGADTLPLLSLTLATLYRDYGGDSELTLSHYTKLGGIDNVVATEISKLLSRDPDTRRDELVALRLAFIPFLATIAPEGERPLRRIAHWRDLPAEARPLIDRFIEARLLVKDHWKNGDREETVVEVALESLLRQWDDLAGWLREEADDLRTAENLERAAEDWNRNVRATAWLLTGARLIAAETLALRPGYRERLAIARDYLAASRGHEDARHADELLEATAHAAALRKRARILIALTTVAVMVAVTAGFYYFRADTAEHNATSLANAAIAARLLQDAQQQFTTGHDTRRGVLEAIAAQNFSPETAMTGMLDVQYQTQNITKIADVGPTPNGMAISPDGRWMVTGDHVGGVRVWDTNSTDGPRTLPGSGTEGVPAVAVSSDGRWVVAGDLVSVVRVWDMTSTAGPRAFSLTGSSTGTGAGGVYAVAVSSDGRWVVAGDRAEVVRIWDTNASAPVQRVLPGTRAELISLVVSPDGRRVVAGDRTGVVRMWDTGSTAEPRTLPSDGYSPVVAVAVSPDGRWVVAGDLVSVVRVWDVTSTAGPRALPGNGNDSVTTVAVTSDGRWVVAGDGKGGVRVWDMTSTAGPRALPRTGTALVVAVGVSPDGRRVVGGDRAGVVRTWDLNSSGNEPRAVPGSGTGSLLIDKALSPDGRWVATNDTAGVVRVGDMNSTDGPRTLPNASTDTDLVYALAISPDGRWLVTSNTESAVRVWDMTSTAGPRALPSTGTGTGIGAGAKAVLAVAISPDGHWVVVGDRSGEVRVSDMSTSVPGLRALPGISIGGVTAVAVSPDRRWVVAGAPNGGVLVWDTNYTDGPRALPSVGIERVVAVAVSADGHWVVTGDRAGVVRVWSTDPNQTGVALAARDVGIIGALALDPGSRSINAVSTHGSSQDELIALPFLVPDPKQLCSKLATTMSRTEWDEWVTPNLPPTQLCDGLK
ncbi:nSTAND1 domain-containing NTPase [Nocardia sp. NBC_00403]|uniref:nSTAND1 domain-containing NTPase n=1 Tax=Nocardia sp. NBC_00403 TaxID=2975990 RepID=UPI002E1FDA61